jgi:nicotinamide-nucleotide amidase
MVLITGGLGPTKDDITKKTMCTYFGSSIEINQEALAEVTTFFAKRGRELTGLNLGQAEIPTNATYIRNSYGTAPAMWFEHDNTVFVSMPGVPFEMKGIMKDTILLKLQAHFKTPFIYHKVIRTIGIGESFLAEMIETWEDALPEHIGLAYLPSMGNVKLRLTGVGENEAQVAAEVEAQFQLVLPTIQEFVYGFGDDEIEQVVGRLLKEKGLTVAVAESCTGGYLAHQFTKVAGSSAYFLGGVLAYSNDVKINSLGVTESTLAQFGAVSEETIIEMAQNVRTLCKASIGLATSGIAGPDGGSDEKPVGTIWIAMATETEVITKKLQLGGSREQNIHLTAVNLLNLVRKKLNVV